MRLEKATLEPIKGLEDFLRKVGRGEGGFGGVPDVTDGRLTVRAYLEREVAWSHGEDLPAVAHTTYWLVDDNDRIPGMCRLRHYLNEKLLKHGGHIGYYIRRESRGNGLAFLLLCSRKQGKWVSLKPS